MTRSSSGWSGFQRGMMASSRFLTDKNWGNFKFAGGLRIRIRFASYETGQAIESEIPLILPILGIQLYTLREDMLGDPEGVLRQLAQFGYSQIESYEGPSGMFWGKSPADFATFVRELGIDPVASHCSIEEGFEQKAENAAAAGRFVVPMV